MGRIGRIVERAQGRGGYTLIELMVVVAIIAFITAAVVPSFSLSLLKNRQREAGMLLVQAVFAARSRAARTGRCHRVTVQVSPTGKDGGFGGTVEVEESQSARECRQAQNANLWNRLSFKAVDEYTAGESHAGLIGNDVAINAIRQRTGPNNCSSDLGGTDPGIIYFEPTGGQADPRERYFEITTKPVTVTRWVRVSPGGAVRYGACN